MRGSPVGTKKRNGSLATALVKLWANRSPSWSRRIAKMKSWELWNGSAGASEEIRRFVFPNYASGRPRLARACVDFKKTDLGLRRYARFKFSPSSLCGRGGSARWICLSLLLPWRDQQYD